MKNCLTLSALLASFAALSACGGITADPNATQSGENVGNLAVSYNAVDTTLIVTDGVVEYTYARDTEGDNGSIAGFVRNAETAENWLDYSLRGETSSGSGEAFLVNSTENGYEAAATFLNRLETPNLPTSGTASFSGDYSGVVFENDDEDSVWHDIITGDATLDANFSDSTVSGSIINRDSDLTGDRDNVTLSVSSISNGAFSGTASGGGGGDAGPGFSGANFVRGDGTYEGMFTGADASEVIGSINIPMTSDGYSGFEMGIFIAEEVTP
jgi:hypothetical protein